MKSSKKALAFALAAAMAITGVPVTNAGAATTTAKLGATKATIYAGNSKYISVSTPSSWKRVKLSVSSSKTSVASVKKNNAKKKIRVDAVKAGTAKVTVKVTAKKSGKTVKKTLSANITVKDYKVRLVDAAGKTVSNTTIDTTVGTAVKLTAKTAPANDKVTFTSDNESVATVDASGNVTPVKAGTVTITAASAKASDKVTINVSEAAKEGLTATLTNPSYPNQEKLENAVLVGNKAVINIKAVKDGKPVVGETVLFTSSKASNMGDEGDYSAENVSAVTNANGIATFVFGYKGTKTADKLRPAAFNYTATVASTGEKVDGTVKFVVATFGTVDNANADVETGKVDADGNSNLVVSKNYSGYADAPKGLSGTAGTKTILGGNNGLYAEYVDSQQTSKEGTKTHQVTFKNYLPKIHLPGYGTATSEGKTFTQTVDYTSGEYHTYTTEKKLVEIKDIDPKELTWAHVNFTNLQLSKDTKLHIKVYGNAAKTIVVDDYYLNGAREESSFTYSIPLNANTNWSKLYVETSLESYGRVDDDRNGGYTIKDITGVYKSQTAYNDEWVELKDAKVTWKLVTAPMNEVKTLSDDYKAILSYALKDAGESNEEFIKKKITYQTPAFPYTGNAILKKYDANGKIESYYVCPTKNDDNNKNILSIATGHCYRVSKEEAERQVGEIIADTGKTVTVNSTHTGVSTLEGKVTDLNGNPIPGFDAVNDTVYTSVQWNPLPADTTAGATTASDNFYALLGQKVDVVAQLTDANGDAVSQAKKKIVFTYDGGSLPAAGNTIVGTGVTVVNVTGNGLTDPNGQVTLTLQAAQKADLLKLKATPAAGQNLDGFKVALKIKEKSTEIANIHWIDADLIYQYVQSDDRYVQSDNGTTIPLPPFPEEDGSVKQWVKTESTANESYKSTTTQLASAGTNWEYAMKVGSNDITISGLKIVMSHNGVGSVNASADVNGMAKVSSTKTGKTQIIGKLNASSVGDAITLTNSKGEAQNYAGYGPTNLDKQLTINVEWLPSGIYPSIVTPNGKRVVLNGVGTKTTVFVSVVDKFTNPNTTKPITITADTAKLTFDGRTVDAGQKLVIPAEDVKNKGRNGVLAIEVAPVDTAKENSSIITATVENETVSSIINWVKADATAGVFEYEKNETVAKQSIKGDTVTLTFTKNIVESSVYAGAFKVYFKNGEDGVTPGTPYEVTSATVSGKTITLKIKNGPTSIPANTNIAVVIEADKEDPNTGIKYTVHSVDGDALTPNYNIPITDK